MKRDMDLVRELLMKLAEAPTPMKFSDLVSGRMPGTPDYLLAAYHMRMLVDEAGLVRGIDASYSGSEDWIELKLTWRGQDFIDTFQSPTVWEHAKSGAAKIGGFSLDLLVDLGKAYLRAEAKRLFGVGE